MLLNFPHTQTHTHTYSHTHTLTLTHTITHTHTHNHTHTYPRDIIALFPSQELTSTNSVTFLYPVATATTNTPIHYKAHSVITSNLDGLLRYSTRFGICSNPRPISYIFNYSNAV